MRITSIPEADVLYCFDPPAREFGYLNRLGRSRVVSQSDVLGDQGHAGLKRHPTNELVPLQGQDRSGAAAASSIRVAHVGNYNPDSADGTKKTIAGFVEWLPRYGVNVEVWQPDPHALTVRERERDGVRIFDLPAYRWPSNFLLGLARQTRAFVLERQRAVNLVHFHSAFIPENSAIASLTNLPYIVTPNGGYSRAILQGRNRWFKTLWMRFREQPHVRRAAILHAVSVREGEELSRLFPALTVIVIHNGIDPSLLTDGVQRQGDGRSKDVLYLGRLAIRQKGLDLLLRGYARFLGRTGDCDTSLLLAGPDYRGDRAKLERIAASLDISSRVTFLGPVYGADKWARLRDAHFFVHPSRYDGLPFSVLEALAASRPVLVTPGSNLGEVVQEYGAGVVVDGNESDIADGIRALANASAEQHEVMARRAKQLIVDQFTWPEATRRLSDAYRSAWGRQDADEESTRPPAA